MSLQDLIPTDNIYKFCAITGLIIVFYAITIPFGKIQELKKQNINNLGERELILLEWAQLEELSESYKKYTENLVVVQFNCRVFYL
jgi:hypothetical protein